MANKKPFSTVRADQIAGRVRIEAVVDKELAHSIFVARAQAEDMFHRVAVITVALMKRLGPDDVELSMEELERCDSEAQRVRWVASADEAGAPDKVRLTYAPEIELVPKEVEH